MVMAQQMTLSRHQIEQVVTWLALDQNVKTVRFISQSKSGIGPDVTAYFYDDKNVPRHDMDITDVSMW
jgi:hypothetical protein